MIRKQLINVEEAKVLKTWSTFKPQLIASKTSRVLVQCIREEVEVKKTFLDKEETCFSGPIHTTRRDRHQRISKVVATVLVERYTKFYSTSMDLTADYQDAVMMRQRHHPRTYTLLLQDDPSETYYVETAIYAESLHIANVYIPTIIGQYTFQFAIEHGEFHKDNILTLYSQEGAEERSLNINDDEESPVPLNTVLKQLFDAPYVRIAQHVKNGIQKRMF